MSRIESVPMMAALCLAAMLVPASPSLAANVTTYHYDNLRTGWNAAETTLTPANVASTAFGLLSQTTLDEQVDAAPLFVAGEQIAGGTYDVVYVATENNTVYAIDANSGNTLLHTTLGPAVPVSALPGGCSNNSANMGINSTPVIDLTAGVMYVISYTYEKSHQTFRIHELSLTTLQDVVPSVVVTASAALKNGKAETFQAASQRQRAALIETSGNIYAGFASFCDIGANISRGWVLGWNAGTLAPLPTAELIDRRPKSPDEFFLSSVWMSGYGIASDDQGSLFFITGNSDYDGDTYNKRTNLAESVVRLSADLTTVQGYFTPAEHAQWDRDDSDFGSAGVLLLPALNGSVPNVAVAGGKTGPLYLLNRDKLGGLGSGRGILGEYTNHGCWCGQAYYQGADGIGRVVSSTGGNVAVYQVKTAPRTELSLESSGPGLNSGQDPGFMTTISSNGTTANSQIVWALPHPADTTITLNAMDPSKGAALIYSATAGSWPYAGSANANLVPVVANGHVFVASYQQLAIFGLSDPAGHVAFKPAQPPAPFIYPGTKNEVTGFVTGLGGSRLTLRSRGGSLITVDIAPAKANSTMAEPSLGHAATVRGDYDAAGILIAKYVLHAKNNPAVWTPDH